MASGFIWERILEAHILAPLKERGFLVDVGEIELDGILMTPDGLNLQEGAVIEEWKFTWKSSRRELTSFHRYLWQLKSYCKGLGVDTGILRVMFCMGDYKGTGPQVKAWKLEFTDRELEENWQMIVNHARKRGWIE